jgi:transketolase
MSVVIPCDGPQTRQAIVACADTPGPFYIRLGRAKFPTVDNKGEFKLGKAQILIPGNDVAIAACGVMVHEALTAAQNLLKKGIKARVINVHTIKPLDNEAILEAAKATRGIVTCEEHSITGGLASSIDEVVTENYPTKVLRVGVRDRFGQSGEPAELLKEYGLTSLDIEKAVLAILA